MISGLKSKKSWIRRLGIPIAAIPIAWIYWRLDFHTMVSIAPKVAWWTGPVLFAIAFTCMVLQGVRWWILLRTFILNLPLGRALSYHFIGAFYGSAIPSGAAQDVIKTLLVADKCDASASWAAIWLTRILGLPALGILSLYGFIVMDKSAFPRGAAYAMAFFYILAAFLFFLSFSKTITRPVRIVLERIIPPGIATLLGDIRQGIYRYRGRKGDVFTSFLVTLLTQVLFVFSAIFTLRGITGHFFIWQCFTFIPIIELISVSFPFTPNGMGVREALSAAMFAYLGLTKEQLGIYVLFLLFFGLAVRSVGVVPLVHGYIKKRRSLTS
jgi:uncharacterized membrane protein YbhN (UPF0104 family)